MTALPPQAALKTGEFLHLRSQCVHSVSIHKGEQSESVQFPVTCVVPIKRFHIKSG